MLNKEVLGHSTAPTASSSVCKIRTYKSRQVWNCESMKRESGQVWKCASVKSFKCENAKMESNSCQTLLDSPHMWHRSSSIYEIGTYESMKLCNHLKLLCKCERVYESLKISPDSPHSTAAAPSITLEESKNWSFNLPIWSPPLRYHREIQMKLLKYFRKS